MAELLFRPEVIQAGRQRLTGAVVAAVPPSSRVYTGLLALVLLAGVAFLALGNYAPSARARGVIAYGEGIARVYPAAAAEIREIHVRPGQQVEAGAPLVTLAVAQGRDGLRPQIAQLAQQDAELARQSELTGALGSSEATGLEQQKRGLQALIGSLERQRALAQGQIGLAETAVGRASRLARQGAGAQRQVEESRAALLSRRAELENLAERLITQREALRALTIQIEQKRLQTSQNHSLLAAQRAALAEQREALIRADQITLTAPVGGEIGDIAMTPGQRAAPDRSLVTIVPAESPLEVWLYAPSGAVGYAEPGQQVRLEFDAFPHQRHGSGKGTVQEVSRVSVEPSSIGTDLGLTEPAFRIRVRIDELPRNADRIAQALRPGMTVSAALVQERRSLWEMFFNPMASAFGR